jgi:hypothetical protein
MIEKPKAAITEIKRTLSKAMHHPGIDLVDKNSSTTIFTQWALLVLGFAKVILDIAHDERGMLSLPCSHH